MTHSEKYIFNTVTYLYMYVITTKVSQTNIYPNYKQRGMIFSIPGGSISFKNTSYYPLNLKMSCDLQFEKRWYRLWP